MVEARRAVVGFIPLAASLLVIIWNIYASYVFACLQFLCYFQELQKLEATRKASEAPSSKAGEASTPKAPLGGADAEKLGEAAFASANPEV